MSEPTTTEEPTTTNNQTEPEPTPGASPQHAERFKDDPVFAHMRDEIVKLRKAGEAREAEIAAAKAEAEQQQLAAQGKWQEIAEKAKADLAAKEAAHSAETRRLKFEALLSGIDNEFVRSGIIAKADPNKEPKDVVDEIKEKYPDLFTPPTDASQRAAAQGARSAGNGGKTISERLKMGDPQARAEAMKRVLSGESI